MHRLIRGAQVGALALLLVFGAGSVACKKGSSGGSTNVLDGSGGNGNSTDGFGGDAGEVDLYIYYGGGGAIEVSSSGSVDASFAATGIFSPDLGSNPLVVSSDLSIAVVTVAPALGTPYMLEDDENLYISDGDMDLGDETPVTGLQVQSGATLTLGLNYDDEEPLGLDQAWLEFSDDIVNDGAITTEDIDASMRGSLDLYSDGDYIGSGRVQTFATLAGQSGGHISVLVLGNGYNSGVWQSYGADQVDGDGGDGGDIGFETSSDPPGGLIENTGDMNSSGGSASGTSGAGGDAGEIDVIPYLALWNSGDLDAIGGDGVDGGGDGAEILIAGYYRGELRNTGDLTSDGGDTEAGDGGDAGELDLEAWGADLRSNGVLLARGGDTAGADDTAGDGGEIEVYVTSSDDNYEPSELDVPAGDIILSGGAVATGGNALAVEGSGGAGGDIYIYLENDISEGAQEIQVFGIKGLHARGGDGGLEGGDGDLVYLDLAYQEGTPTGLVDVGPPMDSSGGDADASLMGSIGGDGGDIDIYAGTIGYGSATADGGVGETPGADGAITPETMAP